MGIIKKKGKMKRMWRYKVCEYTLNQYKIKTQCKPAQEDSATTKHKDAKYYHQEAQILPPGSNYKNNKTSSIKLVLEEDESLLERSSPNAADIQAWAENELDT